MSLVAAIQGEQIYLRSPTETDVQGRWWQWLNDPDVTAHMNKGQVVNTMQRQMEFFNKMKSSDSDCVFAICCSQTHQHIGTTAIHNIHMDGGLKVGSFGILIGEKNFWGKGIGSEVWTLVITEAFDNLNLDAIHTKIFSSNVASLRIAEKVGFKTIEIIKNEFQKGDHWIDRHVLRLDREGWTSGQ